jgi:predicted metal-dependent HD superfamily phosphohydrolase
VISFDFERLWHTTMPAHADVAFAQQAVQNVLVRYAEPHRFYHTLMHLQQVLILAERHRHALIDSQSVILALFYHDAIYNPRRSDNEQQSAALARHSLAQWLPEPRLARIEQLILATTGHALPDNDPDLAMLLTFDLAILAASPQDYAEYAVHIRQEYQHIAEIDYRRGRREVLQHFLDQPVLFAEGILAEDAVHQAHRNILTEYNALGE